MTRKGCPRPPGRGRHVDQGAPSAPEDRSEGHTSLLPCPLSQSPAGVWQQGRPGSESPRWGSEWPHADLVAGHGPGARWSVWSVGGRRRVMSSGPERRQEAVERHAGSFVVVMWLTVAVWGLCYGETSTFNVSFLSPPRSRLWHSGGWRGATSDYALEDGPALSPEP